VGVDPGFTIGIFFNATDCAASVIVNGSLDRVFISAQLDNTITYTATAASTLEYIVALNRYAGTIPTTLSQGEIQYFYDSTVAVQSYQYTAPIGTLTLPVEETIFANVIDIPDNGYYLYRLDLIFKVVNDTGAVEVTKSTLGNRSLSVQVVKQ
jgi:hypothetical protein